MIILRELNSKRIREHKYNPRRKLTEKNGLERFFEFIHNLRELFRNRLPARIFGRHYCRYLRNFRDNTHFLRDMSEAIECLSGFHELTESL